VPISDSFFQRTGSFHSPGLGYQTISGTKKIIHFTTIRQYHLQGADTKSSLKLDPLCKQKYTKLFTNS